MSSLSQKSLEKLKVFRTLLAEEVTMPFRIKKKPIAIMIIVWEKAKMPIYNITFFLQTISRHQNFFYFIRLIFKKLSTIHSAAGLFQTNFKEKQKNSYINTIIKTNLFCRHNPPLSRLLKTVNFQFSSLIFYNPRLSVAGTWSKTHNIRKRKNFTFPYFFQRLSLRFEHILSKRSFRHFRNGNHNHMLKPFNFTLIRLSNSEPQRPMFLSARYKSICSPM